jgi:predicted  nucleic acid-binding Zn-ribbon protein
LDRARDPKEHALKADPADQLRLLDVQALDARLDQLAHRRKTLPELAEVERLQAEIAELRDLTVAAETEVSDLEREVAKAESDVDAVRQRAARDRTRMDTGAVTSAKELESLQHEVDSLARRQGDLEEIELEVMERLDEAQSRLSELRTRASVLADELSTVEARRDEQLTGIAKDVEFASGQRADTVSGVPADLLALYEKLRADHDGVGAAALGKRRCEGCRLELNATDLGRIRTAEPDEVLRCEECRRILVRTPESGL